MAEVSATDAARSFSELLDAVEHRGEHFTIVRHGKPVAHLEPVTDRAGLEMKQLLRRHRRDDSWGSELKDLRRLVELTERR